MRTINIISGRIIEAQVKDSVTGKENYIITYSDNIKETKLVRLYKEKNGMLIPIDPDKVLPDLIDDIVTSVKTQLR